MDGNSQLKAGYTHLDAAHALQAPVSALVGVTEAAAAALRHVGIETVFDVATSKWFEAAHVVAAAARAAAGKPTWDAGDIIADASQALGRIPQDLLDDSVLGLDPTTIASSPPLAIEGIGPATSSLLVDEIGLASVAAMALWPPYRAARALLVSATALAASEGQDQTGALIPAVGGYPTERVQYTALILDKLLTPGGHPAPKPVEDAGPLNLTSRSAELMAAPVGMGARLTFTQTWYPEGLALGQLLHTVALAPGESTKVALIDWSRASMASASEGITEQEALAATVARTRSISEVTSAVADETQTGESWSTSYGASGTSGTGAAFGIPVGGGMLGLGASAGVAGGASKAHSWSTSSGHRELSASMTQQITDRTAQAANAVRNRRATLVQEVQERETETLTTRALTNYNHMHALSVEYYEVVQLYRCRVELTSVDRCLFLPIQPVDFTDHKVLNAYRTTIAAAGLTDRVRRLAELPLDRMILRFANRAKPWEPSDLTWLAGISGEKVGDPDSAQLLLPDVAVAEIRWWPWSADSTTTPVDLASATIVGRDGVPRLVSPFPQVPVSPGHMRKQNQCLVGQDISRISFAKKPEYVSTAGPCYYRVALATSPVKSFGVWADPRPGQEEFVLLECEATLASAELIAHLEENRDHYTAAIFATASNARLGGLLAQRSYNGKPLLEQVDPTPIATTGQHLVLRLPADATDTKWTDFLAEHGIKEGTSSETLIPLPSGGVFAEAILGRANSAERLELGRFWNWQDSPIPFSAPDIAALQAGAHAHSEAGKPGELSSPIVNLVNAPALPDPTGLQATLQALASGSMFRDMSGLSATIAGAQQTLAGTLASAAQSEQTGAGLAQSALGALAGGVNKGQSARTTAPASGTSDHRPAVPATASIAGAALEAAKQLDAARSARSGGGGSSTPSEDYTSAVFRSFLGGPDTPQIVPVSGGTAPAWKTGVGGTALYGGETPEKFWGALANFVGKVAEDLGTSLGRYATGESDFRGSVTDVVKASLEESITNQATELVCSHPVGKAIQMAWRYGSVFADGVGQAIDEKRSELQQRVDEAVAFHDDMTEEEKDRLLRVRQSYWMAATQLEAVLLSGVERLVNAVLDDALSWLSDLALGVFRQITGQLAEAIIDNHQLGVLAAAAIKQARDDIPQLRRFAYAQIAQATAAAALEQLSDERIKNNLAAVVTATGEEDRPEVAVLRGLSEAALKDLAGRVYDVNNDVLRDVSILLWKDLRWAFAEHANNLQEVTGAPFVFADGDFDVTTAQDGTITAIQIPEELHDAITLENRKRLHDATHAERLGGVLTYAYATYLEQLQLQLDLKGAAAQAVIDAHSDDPARIDLERQGLQTVAVALTTQATEVRAQVLASLDGDPHLEAQLQAAEMLMAPPLHGPQLLI